MNSSPIPCELPPKMHRQGAQVDHQQQQQQQQHGHQHLEHDGEQQQQLQKQERRSLIHSKSSALKSKRLTPRSVRQDRRRSMYARPSSAAAAASAPSFFDGERRRPSSEELEDFFTGLEDKMEVRDFMDKYNFDVLHDAPLAGRYEWIKVQE